MKKILILTVVMGIGMVFLSQDAKAQIANNSNVNTPITATLGINLPTAQTQNGTVSVEGGGIFLVGGAPVPPPPPPISGIPSMTLGAFSVPAPPVPVVPRVVIIIQSNSGAYLPGGGGGFTLSSGARILFIGDYPIIR